MRKPATVETAGENGAGSDRAILEQHYGGSPGRGIDIPEGGLDTPHGRLYCPLTDGLQVLVLLGAFFGGAASLFQSSWSAGSLFLWVAAGCISWGYLLAYCGRHGWLPFVED